MCKSLISKYYSFSDERKLAASCFKRFQTATQAKSLDKYIPCRRWRSWVRRSPCSRRRPIAPSRSRAPRGRRGSWGRRAASSWWSLRRLPRLQVGTAISAILLTRLAQSRCIDTGAPPRVYVYIYRYNWPPVGSLRCIIALSRFLSGNSAFCRQRPRDARSTFVGTCSSALTCAMDRFAGERSFSGLYFFQTYGRSVKWWAVRDFYMCFVLYCRLFYIIFLIYNVLPVSSRYNDLMLLYIFFQIIVYIGFYMFR